MASQATAHSAAWNGRKGRGAWGEEVLRQARQVATATGGETRTRADRPGPAWGPHNRRTLRKRPAPKLAAGTAMGRQSAPPWRRRQQRPVDRRARLVHEMVRYHTLRRIQTCPPNDPKCRLEQERGSSCAKGAPSVSASQGAAVNLRGVASHEATSSSLGHGGARPRMTSVNTTSRPMMWLPTRGGQCEVLPRRGLGKGPARNAAKLPLATGPDTRPLPFHTDACSKRHVGNPARPRLQRLSTARTSSHTGIAAATLPRAARTDDEASPRPSGPAIPFTGTTRPRTIGLLCARLTAGAAGPVVRRSLLPDRGFPVPRGRVEGSQGASVRVNTALMTRHAPGRSDTTTARDAIPRRRFRKHTNRVELPSEVHTAR